ncbi:Proline iminopeptidase [subsurface metagenome]
MKYFLALLTFLSFSITCTCQDLRQGEGFVNVQGGRIWFKEIVNGEGIPLLVVHGGPGGRSCGSIAAYSLISHERPVIVFDQLESGFSDSPGDTSLWKLSYFVEQITAIKNALNLKEFHLLGSSWGAAIVIDYMLSANSEEVVSVIFSGPFLSTSKWMEDAKILLAELPVEIQDTIAKYEALEQYDAPAYIAATNLFYSRYLSRTQWPPINSPNCKGAKPFNSAIYNYMWGPTEFNATGTLINFDRTHRLHELKLPVLFIAGEYDEVRVETLYSFQRMIEGAQCAIIPESGHAITTDQPEEYIQAISQFLNGVERQ